MGNFTAKLAKKVSNKAGATFWIKKTITSSGITVAHQNLSNAASGDLAIKQVILQSDTTGIVGPTNFELAVDNGNGLLIFASTAVSGLATSAKTKALIAGSDDSTGDNFLTVVGVPTVLEAGKKITFGGTSAAGTGAGTVKVYIQLERVDENASLLAV